MMLSTFTNDTLQVNSTYLERKYIGIIQHSLGRFKWTSNDTANFRCPICGDSRQSATKARGYLYSRKGKFSYSCKNCSASMSFKNFLRTQFPEYYSEFKMDLLKEAGGIRVDKTEEKEPDFNQDEIQDRLNKLTSSEQAQTDVVKPNGIITIDSLPDNHIAKSYCRNRSIPENKFNELLYTSNFKKWVVEVLGAKKYAKRHLPWDERLLLPLRNRKGDIIGVQGRALDKSAKIRYITIKKNDLDPKIFGIDKLNLEQPVFVVEGPIDSLFLPNCIAVCGGDLNIPLPVEKENVYCLFDNEPRSKDTITRMENAIKRGYNVMFWDIPTQYKDINDMVLKGNYTVRDILTGVKKNSHRGLKAQAALKHWKLANIKV